MESGVNNIKSTMRPWDESTCARNNDTGGRWVHGTVPAAGEDWRTGPITFFFCKSTGTTENDGDPMLARTCRTAMLAFPRRPSTSTPAYTAVAADIISQLLRTLTANSRT
uniref:Uncharacterized protein n=1 Tax=Corethron hystrix TaxID=216773 RepID=A0A7S1BS45_9STRA